MYKLRDFYKKYKDVINGLSLFLVFFCLCLPSMFGGFNSTNFNLVYKITLGLVLVILSFFLILAKKTYPPILLLCVGIIYLLFAFFASILFADNFLNAGISFFSSFANVLFFSLFAFGIRRDLSKQAFYVFVATFLLFIFAAIVFSAIKEHEQILNSFTCSGEQIHFYQIKSFFGSKNLFGFMLLVAIIFNLYALIFERKNIIVTIILWVLLVLNFGFLILTRSKISLAIAVIFAIFSLIFALINLFKKCKSKFIYVLASIIVIFLLVIVCFSVSAIYDNFSFISRIRNYFLNGFIGQTIRSIEYRIRDFKNMEALLLNPLIIIGYGEHITVANIGGSTYRVILDNVFLGSLINGGISKLILIVLVYLFSVKRIRFIQNKKKRQFFSLLAFSFFVFGFFEGYSPLGYSAVSMLMSLLIFYVPWIVFKNERLDKKNSKKVLHLLGAFGKGGTESFVLNYLSEIRKHSSISFDIYAFSDVDNDRLNELTSLGGTLYRGISPSKRNVVKAHMQFEKFIISHSEYSIIHCSANYDNFIYLKLCNDFDFEKRIFHSHDTQTGLKFSFGQKMYNLFRRFVCLANSNYLVACSREAGLDIIGKRFRRKGIILPNAINIEKFKNHSEKNTRTLIEEFNLKDLFVVGNISRFEQKKNQEFMLNVFEKYHAINDQSALVLGGVDGGDLKRIKSLIEDKKLSNSVFLIGPRNDVEDWLAVIDVYLMPSLFEGYGISAIEAQASGTFVLASTNLPRTTDFGLIRYFQLDSISEWVDELKNFDKKRFRIKSLDSIDISKQYAILLNIYTN